MCICDVKGCAGTSNVKENENVVVGKSRRVALSIIKKKKKRNKNISISIRTRLKSIR